MPNRSTLRRVAAIAAVAVAAPLGTTAAAPAPELPIGAIPELRAAGSVTEVVVAGVDGVPGDVDAVALNLTAVGASAVGYVTVYPCGEARPNASSLNYGPGSAVANLAMVKVGAGGAVCLYNGESAVDLIVDVAAWYRSSSFVATNPARLLDSRPGAATVDGTSAGVGVRSAGAVTELQVAGRAGVPGNATAVALNLTTTDSSGTGYVTAWPCGEAEPLASNLNFGSGLPRAGLAFVRPGDGGRICIRASEASTHLIADVGGWFVGNDFRAVRAARLLDTRPGAATVDGQSVGAGVRGANTSMQLQVAGRGGIPSSAESVFLNVTSSDSRGPGFVTAYSCDESRPVASNLNYVTGQPGANLASVRLGPSGQVCLYTGDGASNLIADVIGWTTGNGSGIVRPSRLLDTRTQAVGGVRPPDFDGQRYSQTFDQPDSLQELEIEVHHRTDHDPQGSQGRLKVNSWGGDHDLSCGSPDTQRPLDGYNAGGTVDRGLGGNSSVVYWCRQHMMTSMADVNGWSAIAVSPPFTFPSVRRVCWDQNVTDLGGRQWTQVVVTPVDGGLRNRDGEYHLSHPSPVNGGPDRTGALMTSSSIAVVAGRNNGRITGISNISEQGRDFPGVDTEGVNSKAVRREHCMTDRGNGTIEVRVEQGAGNPDRVLVFPGSFPSNARVVFEDHTYNPDKDGTPLGFTWHWDNLVVETR